LLKDEMAGCVVVPVGPDHISKARRLTDSILHLNTGVVHPIFLITTSEAEIKPLCLTVRCNNTKGGQALHPVALTRLITTLWPTKRLPAQLLAMFHKPAPTRVTGNISLGWRIQAIKKLAGSAYAYRHSGCRAVWVCDADAMLWRPFNLTAMLTDFHARPYLSVWRRGAVQDHVPYAWRNTTCTGHCMAASTALGVEARSMPAEVDRIAVEDHSDLWLYDSVLLLSMVNRLLSVHRVSSLAELLLVKINGALLNNLRREYNLYFYWVLSLRGDMITWPSRLGEMPDQESVARAKQHVLVDPIEHLLSHSPHFDPLATALAPSSSAGPPWPWRNYLRRATAQGDTYTIEQQWGDVFLVELSRQHPNLWRQLLESGELVHALHSAGSLTERARRSGRWQGSFARLAGSAASVPPTA